jgi:phosphate transport system substrate-binding protein
MRWCLIAAFVAAACVPVEKTHREPKKPLIRIGGSETIVRQLIPPLTQTHMRTRDTMRFATIGGGSSVGYARLLDRDLELAATSRKTTPAEREQANADGYDLTQGRNIVAVDVVAISVHPENPLDSLTYDQVIGIFCTRSIDNWLFLGLDDGKIRAVTRDPGSGTRALFEDFFCGPRGINPRVEVMTADDILTTLATDPNAISYVSMSRVNAKVLGLRTDAASDIVRPTQQNIIRGIYPLYHDLYFYSAGRAKGHVADFIDWIGSPAGQEVVDEAGFVPLFLRPERLDTSRPLRETIHFDEGAAMPNQRSLARLQLLDRELRERAGEYRHLILEGYTDNREKHSEDLARERAETVRDLLLKKLPGLYFEIIPRGAASPLAPNETPYGRQRNRRVQIYLAAEENLGANNEAAPDEESAKVTEED